MNLKKFGILCGALIVLGASSQVFAATAIVDVDRVMFQYTKAKTMAEQFRLKDEHLALVVVKLSVAEAEELSPVHTSANRKVLERKSPAPPSLLS